MKTTKLITVIISVTLFTACSSDDDSGNIIEIPQQIVSDKAENIAAPQTGGQGEPTGGEFTKFDFESGSVTTSNTEWDIAFRGTTIAINGGTATGTNDEPERNGNVSVAIVTGTFAEIAKAPAATEFYQDQNQVFAIPTGSGNGWYNYNFMTNTVSPIAGKVFVFRTRNNTYAKIEILSYYKDAPANPDGNIDEARFYTFNYSYNPNPEDTNLD